VLNDEITAALRAADARWAYTRVLDGRSSITMFFRRAAE
jgi:hypothetical protein